MIVSIRRLLLLDNQAYNKCFITQCKQYNAIIVNLYFEVEYRIDEVVLSCLVFKPKLLNDEPSDEYLRSCSVPRCIIFLNTYCIYNLKQSLY